MSEHAILSPSQSGEWLRCPASVSRQIGIPDPTNPAAEWGIESHTYLEQGLNLGLSPEFLHDGTETKREKAECAVMAFDYSQARQGQLKPCVVHAEVKVNPGFVLGLSNCTGTADVILASSSTLEVVDLKTGRKLVEPDSFQLRLYLLGVLNDYWPDRSIPCPFTTFLTTIVQPRVGHREGPVRSQNWTLPELLEFEQTLDIYGRLALSQNPPARPGTEQCHWCRAKSNCPEYHHWMESQIENMAGTYGEPGQAPVQTAQALDLAAAGGKAHELTGAVLASYKAMQTSIENWFAAVNDEIFARLSKREEVPGYKIVRGKGKPTWKSEKELVPKELRKLKLRKAQIFNDALKTPLQVMKGDLDEGQSAAVAELWARPEGAFKVVADTNPGDDTMAWIDTIPDKQEKKQ